MIYIRLSTKVVADWSILVFLSNGVATKPAMKIQYNLSLFINLFCDIFEHLLQFLILVNNTLFYLRTFSLVTECSDHATRKLLATLITAHNNLFVIIVT